MIIKAPDIDSEPIQGLRGYQSGIYKTARPLLAKHRAICIQLHTGGGKTAIASEMVRSVFEKEKIAWFITPRKALVDQASKHFLKWGVSHGIINANSQESRAYNIHVVSKETLSRRWEKIKRWPDLIIIDECHINYDFQIELLAHAPAHTKFIGFTATPERLDGRGLSEVYPALIEGPSIPWLTERKFLTDLRYFAPPIQGLSELHTKGTEYDEEELEALLERRKIYGELVGHYSKHGKGKAALIFCRSVKSAYQTAERFRDKGFNFHCIEGKMPEGKRKDLIAALTAGTIDGLTNCEIATYGLDIPRIEYGASIRPTLSRALYFQMIGRLLRPWKCPETGREKEDALFFDHVNLVLEHQEPEYPGVPPHYVPEIKWNFHGTEKRKKKDKNVNLVSCPHLDFMYCKNPKCATCQHNPDKSVKDARQPMIIVPAELQEKEKPKPMNERPPEERREIQDQIGAAVLDYRKASEEYEGLDKESEEGKEKIQELKNMASGAVGELLKIADSLGYRELWVYYRLTDEKRMTVNVPLLSEIGRQRGYQPGWTHYARKKIKAHKNLSNEYKEAMEA